MNIEIFIPIYYQLNQEAKSMLSHNSFYSWFFNVHKFMLSIIIAYASLSELTPIIFDMVLTHLGLETFIYGAYYNKLTP